MHKQLFKALNIPDMRSSFPTAEYISDYGFYIPSGLSLNESQSVRSLHPCYHL